MESLSYTREDIEEGFARFEHPTHASSLTQFRALILVCAMTLALILVFTLIFGVLTYSVLFFSNNALVLMNIKGNLFHVAINCAAAFFIFFFLVVFVLRGLGSSRNKGRYVYLNREQQPELYAFVDKLAMLVGSKPPSVIKIDSQTGLSIKSPDSAFFSLGGRKELVIGLPLLYTLSAREFAGVVTHAFSLFNRASYVRGYPVVAVMSAWLYQAAHSDVNNNDVIVRSCRLVWPFVSLVWLFDFIARWLFCCLSNFYGAISFDLSREMDMLADMNSAKVAGSQEFRSTQFKLRALFYGQQYATEELRKGLKVNKLPKNFARLISSHADTMKLEDRSRLTREMEQKVTSMTRSRIVDLGRIINVEKHQFEGSCFLLGMAVRLLKDPEGVGCDVSIRHYVSEGIAHPERMVEDAIDPGLFLKSYSQHDLGLDRIFCGWEVSGRFFSFENVNSYNGLSAGSREQDLQDISSKLMNACKRIKILSERYSGLTSSCQEFYAKKTLTAAKLHVNDASFSEKLDALRNQEVNWLRALSEQGCLRGDLSYFEALLSRRISLALSLAIDTPSIKNVLIVEDVGCYIDKLEDTLSFLSSIHESYVRLEVYVQTLSQLLDCKGQSEESLMFNVRRYQQYCILELEIITRPMEVIEYPFPSDALNNTLEPSIADVLAVEVPGVGVTVSDAYQACQLSCGVLEFVEKLHQSSIGEVAKMASYVERYYRL